MEDNRRNSWGFSLFCDDVRSEVGGKVSIMGLYQNDYIFQGTFPFVIPKLAIFVMYYELAGTISDDINFKVFFPGDEPEKPTIDMPILRKDLPPPDVGKLNLEEGQEPIFHARIPIVLSPLVIKEAGKIKVRAQYSNGKILRLGVLNMIATPIESVPAVSNEQIAKSPG
jgi:hypothetical protein